MSEEKAKIFLNDLLKQSGSSYKIDEILSIFRKPKDIATNKRLIGILKEITNNISQADKHIEIFNKSIKTKDPYECFINFLIELSKYKERKSSKTSLKKNMITEPSSTNIHKGTRESIHEIREKIIIATAGGLSKNPNRRSLNDNLNLTNTKPKKIIRPFSSYDFNNMEIKYYLNRNVEALPLHTQELTVINELLLCFVGIEGDLITVPEKPTGLQPVHFQVSDQLHTSFIDAIKKILPLANYHSIVQRFIQYAASYEMAQVLPALGNVLKEFIQDFHLSISKLESEFMKGNLDLYKLIFYLTPALNTMEILNDLAITLGNSNMNGGTVLSILHEKIIYNIGDKNSEEMLIHLTQVAAIPFMRTLQLWILKGVIIDPKNEFFIEDNELIGRDELSEHQYSADYWEKRYTISRERTPNFLKQFSDVILRTGKYLNVIRQCGKNVTPPMSETLSYSHNNQYYETFIISAHQFASRTLLELLIKENDLIGYLQSVKRYFLLQQGDFIDQFLDATEQELSKNVDDVVPMCLENLLGLTLRTSLAKYDPYNDDLKIELLPYDLIKQMSKISIKEEDNDWNVKNKIDLTGLECFTFRYEVKWPVSLVLNNFAIIKYQMLFRLLFYCKHIEKQLNRAWIATNHAKKFSPETAELYRSAFTLRQRMMNAIQNIEYYMLVEIIEPNWHLFIEKINKVENVDEVLRVHQDFLDHCIDSCMLRNSVLLKYTVNICTVSLNFCNFIQKAQKYFLPAELTSMLCSNDASDYSDSEYDMSSQRQKESSLAPSETFSERVKNFDSEFTSQLIGLLSHLEKIIMENPSCVFVNLIYRLNFNSFYDDHLRNKEPSLNISNK